MSKSFTWHVAALLVLLPVVSLEVLPMSPFNPLKTCVFSSVKARLTMNGEPLKGATVIRRWEWQNLREDRTVTDDQGFFSFAAVFESSVTRLMPAELVIAQGLYVAVPGQEERKIWSNSKRKPQENQEFNGRPISMSCELTHEMRLRRDFGSRMNTLCTWE